MFILLIKLLSLIHLSDLRLYSVCFGILIVSLNTTFSDFFMFTPRFHKTFGHGHVGLKSWTPIGQHVYEPCSLVNMC